MKRRTFLLFAAGGAVAAGVPVRRAFAQALAEARARIAVPTRTVQTRFGTMQWAEAGTGPPVLMLHGTGGGFDQGLMFCQRLIAAGWRVIAPSRFGYLGTAMPERPDAAKEADALADLLDAVGVERLPVMGGSAGAMPAVEFAIRHPDRTTGLVAIVPAAFAPGRPPVGISPRGAAIMRHALRSDFLFWAGMALAKGAMFSTLLATAPALIHDAPPAERRRARAILRAILPVSARAEGILYDGQAAGDPAPQALEGITAPTLAISLEDDRFHTLAAARHIAATVPGARLVTYPSGGHIWVGRDAELMGEIDRFLRGF